MNSCNPFLRPTAATHTLVICSSFSGGKGHSSVESSIILVPGADPDGVSGGHGNNDEGFLGTPQLGSRQQYLPHPGLHRQPRQSPPHWLCQLACVDKQVNVGLCAR